VSASDPDHRSVRRRVGFLLAWLLVVLGVVLPAGPSVAADRPELAVTLTDARLTGTGPDAVVRIEGTVTNASSAAAYGVRVDLWRSTVLLRSRGALLAALSASSSPLGQTFGDAPGRTLVVTDADDAFAPGSSRAFALTATLADLQLRVDDATWWVGANAYAGAEPGGVPTLAGRGRTLVSVPGDTRPAVTSVVELASRPRQLRPNLFSDDTLADELAGRLDTLATAAAAPGFSHVVDPALLVELADMADGYRVVTGSGTAEGRGADAAAAFLARVRGLPSRQGHATLFARPDLGGAQEAGAGAELLGWARGAAATAGATTLPTLVTVDAVRPSLLDALGDDPVAVLSGPLGVEGDLLEAAGRPVVQAVAVADAATSPVLGGGPLADAATLTALARVSGSQVRLLRTAEDVAVDRAATPDWMVRRSLADVLAGDRTPWDPPLVEGPAVVTPDAVDDLRDLAVDLATYGDAAPASGVGRLASAQAARGASLAWSGAEKDRQAWVQAVDTVAGGRALASGLSLDAAPRFSMSSSESQFPVTVTNDLPDPVLVRVVATTGNPQRIRFLESAPVELRAGGSETILLNAEATANGVVTARVRVDSTANRRLTPDTEILVESTNLGLIGWVIVGVSGVVLVVTTTLRIRQVRRAQAREVTA